MEMEGLLWLFVILCLVVFSLVALRFYLASQSHQSRLWHPNEKYFTDTTDTKVEFPSLTDHPSLYLSLIIPAYNEEQRLPIMLDETLHYLNQRQALDRTFTFELIIVDDGSKDDTSRVALQYSKRETSEKIRLLKLIENRGKGGAVKRGMLCARGKYLLMVDADGATRISDLEKLEKQLQKIEGDGLGVAVGSRHFKDTHIKKSFLRNVLTWGFHMIVETLCVRGVKDTQCGFKLFTRQAALPLFRLQHIERWAFDVELLYIAQCLSIPIIEVGVNWTEIEGSKISPFWDSLKMARDIVKIRLMYVFGIWTTETRNEA